MLTLTTHSGLRIGMLSCFSVRLRQWDAGLTWPEWDITQNMNLPIIMFIPHVHVCVQGHDHVCTSLNQHEIHSNRERSHSRIWFSILLKCTHFHFPRFLKQEVYPSYQFWVLTSDMSSKWICEILHEPWKLRYLLITADLSKQRVVRAQYSTVIWP